MVDCFVNTYVRDRERVRDMERWFVYGQKRQVITRVLGIAVLLFVAAYFFYWYLGLIGIFFLSFLVTTELLRFSNYRKIIRLVLQRDAEANQGQPVEFRITIKDDNIHMEDTTGSIRNVPLSQVKWATRTKKMVIICTKGQFLFQLPNDTFTQGTAEELIAYLRAKGIGS